MKPYYSRRYDAVVITNSRGLERVLDKPNLREAIANIKRNKDHYYTERAYQSHLKTYEDALVYLVEEIPE